MPTRSRTAMSSARSNSMASSNQFVKWDPYFDRHWRTAAVDIPAMSQTRSSVSSMFLARTIE